MERQKKTAGDEDLRKIIIWLGQRFAEVSAEFVPRLAKALATTDKKVKFSADVVMQYNDEGVVECFLVPKAPKIPTADLEPRPFVCSLGLKGQLMFEFDGDTTGLKLDLERRQAQEQGATPEPTPDAIEQDSYQPSDHAAASDADRQAAYLKEHSGSTAPA